MSNKSHENLKAIWFEEELLPNWAQILDVAARLCPVADDTRRWFSRFTRFSGVEDSRVILEHCGSLEAALQTHSERVCSDLQRTHDDQQPSQIVSAWRYALETMTQQAHSKASCRWIVEGAGPSEISDSTDGDITLRRV